MKKSIVSKSIVIKSTYDLLCPKPVFNRANQIVGYGCVSCDPSPEYCPYFDKGIECDCTSCDINTPYQPKKIYKQVGALVDHLSTHGITITESVIQFIKSNYGKLQMMVARGKTTR
jgi:hypothetical protein